MTAADVLAAYAPPAGLLPMVRPSDFGRRLADAGDHARRWPRAPLMAPMAGVSDAAYRLMARAGGAELAYTEMVSVNGLHYGSDKTWELVMPGDGEPDVAVQLFGADPALFEEAARAVGARLGARLALIDVNMACPVPKVVRNGAGSALLDQPDRAAAIIDACLRGSGGAAVTAKIRMGRRSDEDVAVDFARALAGAGAAAVAVHGRTATQLYAGSASWDVVRRVSEASEVPVIGSGDVRSADDAVALARSTGCAAVMVARGSYGNPWVFEEARRIAAGEGPAPVTVGQRIAALECHLRLLDATGAHLARGRSLCGWYLRGLPNAARWRNAAMACVTLDDYLALVDGLRGRLDAAGRGC